MNTRNFPECDWEAVHVRICQGFPLSRPCMCAVNNPPEGPTARLSPVSSEATVPEGDITLHHLNCPPGVGPVAHKLHALHSKRHIVPLHFAPRSG